MYISAYTDTNEIVISYTIVHTQHNTWSKKEYTLYWACLTGWRKMARRIRASMEKKSYN